MNNQFNNSRSLPTQAPRQTVSVADIVKNLQELPKGHLPMSAMVPDFSPQGMKYTFAMCQVLAKSEIVPSFYKDKPENILAASTLGAKFGWDMLQSVRGIVCMRGQAMIWGDGLNALIQSQEDLKGMYEKFKAMSWLKENDKDQYDYIIKKHGPYDPEKYAVCVIERMGKPDVVQIYTIEDAKKWHGSGDAFGKYNKAPARNLQRVARRYACQDAYGDVLFGTPVVDDQEHLTEIMQRQPELAASQELLPETMQIAQGQFIEDVEAEQTEQVQEAEEIQVFSDDVEEEIAPPIAEEEDPVVVEDKTSDYSLKYKYIAGQIRSLANQLADPEKTKRLANADNIEKLAGNTFIGEEEFNKVYATAEALVENLKAKVAILTEQAQATQAPADDDDRPF